MPEELKRTEAVEVWEHFKAICAIPHCSGQEEKLKDYIVGLAEDQGLDWEIDRAGNLLVRRPGSAGDYSEGVVLQCHLDMVCEKNADSPVDPFSEPLRLKIREDDWLGAEGTSLGADNGIGVAVCLALMDIPDLRTVPLELLFTVQEEVGLVGAKGLDPNLIKNRRLINLDSEDIGSFYVGCAGSLNTDIFFSHQVDDVPAGRTGLSVEISGLKGGHSGLDINLGRGNAIRLMAGFLKSGAEQYDIRLGGLQGGSSRNAIPRSCRADIFVLAAEEADMENLARQTEGDLRREFAATEPDLTLNIVAKDRDNGGRALGSNGRDALLAFLTSMPNGVISMEADLPDMVRTSSNLAQVDLRGGRTGIFTKQRSSSQDELTGTSRDIADQAVRAGARARAGDGYPPWQVNPNSVLTALAQKAYSRALGRKARVESMHAGLECSIIGGKYPDMDMISIGANILSPHSPDERIQISSVDKLWKFIKSFLAELAEPTI